MSDQRAIWRANGKQSGDRSPARIVVDKSDDALEPLSTITAADFCLGELGPIDYLSKPSLVRGGMTIVYGAPKVGKTTFVARMVHGILDPSKHPFLGGTESLGGPALWLDLDQPRRVSQRRLKEAGAHTELHVYRGPPPPVARLLATIDGWGCRCLIVDNLSRWLQLESENDNAEIERKLGPYQHELQASDITTIVIDHAGKSDGATGRTLRGGSHKLALVDIAVEVKAEGPLENGRRRLCFTSREEPHADQIIRLEAGGYILEGSAKTAVASENEQRIRDGLRFGHQRKDALAEYLKVSTKTVEAWIKPMIDRGEVKPLQSPGAGRPIVYHVTPEYRSSEKSLGSSDSGGLP